MEKQDLIGSRYGRLTVQHLKPCGGGFTATCRCDCGNFITKCLSYVKSVKSCGCRKRDWSKHISNRQTSNIAGQRFGRLLVLDRLPPVKGSAVRWRCLCDCGTETIARGTSLRAGHTTSCGCAKKTPAAGAGKIKHLGGQMFGRLRVIGQSGGRSNGKIVWLCRCLCGTAIRVRSSQLINGETKSCGCLKLEVASSFGINPSRLVS